MRISNRRIVLALSLVALSAAACGRESATANAASADAPVASDRPESVSAVALSEQGLKAIKLGTIEEHELSRTLSVSGKVQFADDHLAHLLVPLAGQVVGVRVKVGDTVTQGQVVGTIASREATAAIGEHIDSHKDLELAEKTASMTEDLFAHEAASKIALQQTQNDLAKARARVTRAEEALRVLGLTEQVDTLNGQVPLTAPIAGTVLERRVVNGEFVQTDSMPLMTIGNLSEVWILGDVFENDLRFVDVGQRAVVSTAAYPGEEFEGRVSYISDTIDPATRTAKVRVIVPNPHSRLKAEMFASVKLSVSPSVRAPTVPSRAVVAEDGRTYVYVQISPGHFARRAITLGPDEGPERQVLGGVKAGDAVVVEGVLLLRQEEDRRTE